MELYNNQLKFYPATLYDILGKSDSRLKIRILPIMADIEDPDLLPTFPCLFKNTILNGYSEVKDGITKAENLLVLSNEDFTFGWVVCKSNIFSNNDSTDESNLEFQNPNFDLMKKNLERCRVDGIQPDTTYENLIVQTLVFENDKDSAQKGGMIEFYNFRTGEKFIIHSSGTGMAITAGGIRLFAGNQATDEKVESASGKFSYLELTPNKLTLNVNQVDFVAKHISFGGGNRYLLASTSSAASYAEGKDSLSIKDKNSVTITA